MKDIRFLLLMEYSKWNVAYVLIKKILFKLLKIVKWELFFAANDETIIVPIINSNESTVDFDGESSYKCTDLTTDDSSTDSNTQSSYTTFASTIENSDSTEMQ